ncbi:MAG: hypothetical protein ACEQSX_07980 [Baekduiaceae bacterium]
MILLSPLRLGWRITTGVAGFAGGAAVAVAEEVAARILVSPIRPRSAPADVAARPVSAPPPAPAPRPSHALRVAPPAVEPPGPALEPLSAIKTLDDTPKLVESEGAASPGAQLRVDAPWDGYEHMKAADIVDRLVVADAAQKAVVRLYEQQHRGRKSVLAAAS